MDKPGAQPERVKQELADIGILPEEWGGEVSMVSVSFRRTSSHAGSVAVACDITCEMRLLTWHVWCTLRDQ